MLSDHQNADDALVAAAEPPVKEDDVGDDDEGKAEPKKRRRQAGVAQVQPQAKAKSGRRKSGKLCRTLLCGRPVQVRIQVVGGPLFCTCSCWCWCWWVGNRFPVNSCRQGCIEVGRRSKMDADMRKVAEYQLKKHGKHASWNSIQGLKPLDFLIHGQEQQKPFNNVLGGACH